MFLICFEVFFQKHANRNRYGTVKKRLEPLQTDPEPLKTGRNHYDYFQENKTDMMIPYREDVI